MKILIHFRITLTTLLACLSLPALADEAALDQPAPPALRVHFTTFHARLDALQHAMPLRVILPPGLADFVAQIDREETPSGTAYLGKTASFKPTDDETCRSFLNDTCSRLDLRWRYDAAQDAVVTDFAWRREDSRSPAELLPAANFSQPTGMFGDDPWNEREWGPSTLSENDAALRAFDALVSKPENFPGAWKLRFLEDDRPPQPAPSLWAGTMHVPAAQPRFVYLRYHPATSAHGLATFACYVFNPQGHFLSGALMTDGYSNTIAPAVLPSRDRQTLYLTRRDHIFGAITLASEGIVLRSTSPFQGDWLGHALWRSP